MILQSVVKLKSGESLDNSVISPGLNFPMITSGGKTDKTGHQNYRMLGCGHTFNQKQPKNLKNCLHLVQVDIRVATGNMRHLNYM